jgi:hypothetical protein
MNYGDIALGVECALPVATRPARRPKRALRLITWLIAALGRWA